MNELINNPIKKSKEQVFTFLSRLKSETGYLEIKFDFTESKFRKLSDQEEGEEDQILSSHYSILTMVEKLKTEIKELTGQETHIAEFSIYETPSKSE
ncbi:hypothetical protein V9L05_18145 [Bernardetia sp. Wsw4-3y2]|uniref:hypothetical protein n=1 Tax=Bernardetia sp. Wsw4-3y2 TaxID=3127471 RepID=UPI0030CF7F21